MPRWRIEFPGVEELKVAWWAAWSMARWIKHANIGISLPGTGENPKQPVYIDGKHSITLKGARIAEEFQQILLDYVKGKYSRKSD